MKFLRKSSACIQSIFASKPLRNYSTHFENALDERQHQKVESAIILASKFDKLDFSYDGIQRYLMGRHRYYSMMDQRLNISAVNAMGINLAAGHFFLFRGAGVKFVGMDFIRVKEGTDTQKILPSVHDPTYAIEFIDTNGMKLHYEALEYLEGLTNLKGVSFSDNERFDNFFLEYLTVVAPGIEYLDISNCKNVDYMGMTTIYRFKKLKYLLVHGISDTPEFQLACLTLEDDNANLSIYQEDVLEEIPEERKEKLE